jgi:1-acyl-sn-glycerol-3-phosphate acyltransferase
MGNFFYGLYRFFERRRIVLWALFIAITAGSAFLASRLRTEEQISGKTVGGTAAGRIQQMAGNIRLTDNLIIRIFPSDTSAIHEPDRMISFATELTDSLHSLFDSAYIGSISPDPADTGFLYLANLVSGNLPVYLEAADYSRIDSLTQPEVIRENMKNNYRLLTTPAGMVMRDRILSDPLGLSGITMGRLKSLQAGEQYTIIGGQIFTADGKNLLLFLASANPASETARNGQLLAGIDSQIAKLKSKYPGIDAEYWGGIAMGVGNATQLKKDITVTLSLAVFFIFLLLAWYFRNLWIPLIGFLPAVFGGVVALALFFIIKGTVSAIALGIGAVILGLIVDYALYLINRYRKTGSVETVIREMSQTIILCALTSIGAFLCLLFLDSSVLFDLGLFAAFSLAGAAVFALVFLPHLLSSKISKFRTYEILNWVDRICKIKLERNWWVTGSLLVLGVLSLCFIGRVNFEEDMNALNFVTPELKSAGDKLERISEVSLKNIYVVATGKDLDQALAAAGTALPPISQLAGNGTVKQYSGVQGLLLTDEIQRERIVRWKHYWTAEKQRAVKALITSEARSLGMKPSAFEPWFRMMDDPGNGLSENEKQALTRGILRNWVTSHDEDIYVTTILRVPAENRAAVYNSLQDNGNVTVFDRQQLTEQFVEGVKEDFERLVTLTMIFVTLLLIFSFGRIETGLITALPMFFSWLLTLGFMGITGIRFNIFNIIISSFIFGLGVDYSILMMRGLLHNFKYGQDETQNYKVSVFLSSATTLIGVAALFFARHPALHSIALVAVFGVAAVVLVTWTFEPLLVKLFLLDRKAKGESPVFARAFMHAIFIAWIPITSIAVIMVIWATLISPVLPLKKKSKQALFHKLFSALSRFYIATNFPRYHRVENTGKEDFRKPAIIIVNHQSLIETPAMLRLHPNILIMANTWVFRNWVFGPVARVAGFIPIDEGIEDAIDVIKQRIDSGYSVLIFPEGSRSIDGHIRRFHRGAFYVAEKLQLDIVPVLIFGSGDFLKKGIFWGRPNRLFMKIMPRIRPEDPGFGTTYQDHARGIRQYYIREYAAFKQQHGTTSYYRRSVIHNYLYKGPVLEWYVRIKLSLEDNFRHYHEHLPLKGSILDLGCGYGYMTFMLAFTSEDRMITGVDHDPEKILVADNCHSKNHRTGFVCADVMSFPVTPRDGIILGDLLHYLPEEHQVQLLHRCMENLKPGGVLLIREGIRGEGAKHNTTKFTEFFSTRMGFNKTPDPGKKLHFLSESLIRRIAEQHQLPVTVLASKKRSSNVLLKLVRR